MVFFAEASLETKITNFLVKFDTLRKRHSIEWWTPSLSLRNRTDVTKYTAYLIKEHDSVQNWKAYSLIFIKIWFYCKCICTIIHLVWNQSRIHVLVSFCVHTVGQNGCHKHTIDINFFFLTLSMKVHQSGTFTNNHSNLWVLHLLNSRIWVVWPDKLVSKSKNTCDNRFALWFMYQLRFNSISEFNTSLCLWYLLFCTCHVLMPYFDFDGVIH